MLFSHFGITVSDLQAAEDFYCRQFDMRACIREVLTDNGWRTLEADLSPAAAAARGLQVGMVVLKGEGFALSLTQESEHRSVLLEHAAFVVGEPRFSAMRRCAVEDGCQLLQNTPRRFVFVDPFGMVWEIMDRDMLYSARQMGHGWIDADGNEHASVSELELQ